MKPAAVSSAKPQDKPAARSSAIPQNQPAPANGAKPQNVDPEDDVPQEVKNRRAHPRETVMYNGRLRHGANDNPCTVLNISAGGAQIRYAQPVRPLMVVTLHIERFGAFHARVCWQRGDKVGLQFLEDVVLVTRRIVSAPNG
jgi:hypothetical protein